MICVKDVVIIGDKFTYFFGNDKHFPKKNEQFYIFLAQKVCLSHTEIRVQVVQRVQVAALSHTELTEYTEVLWQMKAYALQVRNSQKLRVAVFISHRLKRTLKDFFYFLWRRVDTKVCKVC